MTEAEEVEEASDAAVVVVVAVPCMAAEATVVVTTKNTEIAKDMTGTVDPLETGDLGAHMTGDLTAVVSVRREEAEEEVTLEEAEADSLPVVTADRGPIEHGSANHRLCHLQPRGLSSCLAASHLPA